MGIQKITFDGSAVPAKLDSEIYHFLLSNKIGILSGLKNACSFSHSGNTITFNDGYVSVYGRLVYIEPNTQIAVNLDSNRRGFVVLGFNTNTNEVTLYTKELTGSYPSLIQNNLHNTNGLYEFVLCAYSKSVTHLTIDNAYRRSIIETNHNLIDTQFSELKSTLGSRVLTPTRIQDGIFQVSITEGVLRRSLLMVQISGFTHFYIPGMHLFRLGGGSMINVNFTNLGQFQHVGLVFNSSNNTLRLTFNNRQVRMDCIYLYTF